MVSAASSAADFSAAAAPPPRDYVAEAADEHADEALRAALSARFPTERTASRTPELKSGLTDELTKLSLDSPQESKPALLKEVVEIMDSPLRSTPTPKAPIPALDERKARVEALKSFGWV